MPENVIEQLKTIIATELDVNLQAEAIAEDVSLFEDGLGLDSVSIVEFITLIEQHFGFQFSDDELSTEPFQNLQVLATFITTKLTQQQ